MTGMAYGPLIVGQAFWMLEGDKPSDNASRKKK